VTPYKQLYKDPALLVCIKENVCSIEGIHEIQDAPGSLKARVRTAIADADSKYADVWKLYVFISDGLFYTGLLAKLLPGHPCAKDSLNHKADLEIAQRLTVRAIRCAWDYWSTQRDKLWSHLEEEMSDTQLSTLLGIFVKDGERLMEFYPEVPQEVSVVAIDQYLHGAQPNDKCRDIRYKYDQPFGGNFSNWLHKREVDGIYETILNGLLDVAGLSPMNFDIEELKDLVTRVRGIPSTAVNGFYAALNKAGTDLGSRQEVLGRLWRQEPGWDLQWLDPM
jgi:hypothetical protein